mgnify:CR=1
MAIMKKLRALAKDLPTENATLHGKMIIEKRSVLTGEITETIVIDNLVCNTGKNTIAARLNGETVLTNGILNYMAVGTGTNIPAVSDTTLQTEIARTTVSSNSRSLNIATITFFFGSASGNGTLREAGAFFDGTPTLNSGALFDRVNINVTKTTADTLTITLIVTVN